MLTQSGREAVAEDGTKPPIVRRAIMTPVQASPATNPEAVRIPRSVELVVFSTFLTKAETIPPTTIPEWFENRLANSDTAGDYDRSSPQELDRYRDDNRSALELR